MSDANEMSGLDKILKMANEVQMKVGEAQNLLNRIEVEGQSGGGLVRMRATAKGRILKLDIDPSLLTVESKEMTEDLIIACLNDTRNKADTRAQEEMQKLTAGLPLPPGMKL